MEDNKKWVSDVLTQEEIDKFGKRTAIIAGTGAGKNRWVEEILYNKTNRVLLVTSRSAKKDETTFAFLKDGSKKDMNHLFDNGILNSFAVMTNAGLAKALREFKSISSFMRVLELFDYIVIDEAHSLIDDSAFSNSAFYIWEIIKLLKNPKVIFMSATLDIAFSQKLKEEKFERRDLSRKCTFVWPKKIIFTNYHNAQIYLGYYSADRKAVYFSTSASRIKKTLLPEYKTSIDDMSVAAVISDGNHDGLANADKENLNRCNKLIVEGGMLPDDVRILFSTSKLKEGINLNDKRIKTIFVESHCISDIIQFAGRVRNEADCMYIIDDAEQYRNRKNLFLEKEYQAQIIESINEGIQNLELDIEIEYENADKNTKVVKNNPFKIKKLNDYIKYFEKAHSFVKYNPFIGEFQIFEQKVEALKSYFEQQKLYDYNQFDLVSEYFTGVKVFGIKFGREEMVANYLKKKDYLNVELIRKDVDSEILEVLSKLKIKNTRKEEYNDLKSALKALNIDMEISDCKEKMKLSIMKKKTKSN